MAGTPKTLVGPAFITNAAADILVAPASSTYNVVYHIHLANTDSSARTVTLYLGATGGSAAGTELFKTKTLAAAGSTGDTYDYWCRMSMSSTQFLSGLADTTNKVTIMVEGDRFVSSV